MKKGFVGFVAGVATMAAISYFNPYFPLILFCVGRLWGAARCF